MKSANPLAEDLDHILAHTEGLWEELRGQRIFITGGTGFFGCWLLESFAWANDKLGLNASAVVLTRNPESFAAKMPHLAGRSDLIFHSGDVRSFSFPAGPFAFVIHAGTTSSATLEPLEMFGTIVDGTQHVLEFAVAHGTRKLLFVSSGAVYGKQPAQVTHMDETQTSDLNLSDPASSYGEGKRAAEMLCALHSNKHGFDVKIARCFAFVGPHLPLDAHFAISNFIRDALTGRAIRVLGDGTPQRSYLYAADLVVWLWTILYRGGSGRNYNVGSDDAISIAQLAALVKATLGSPHSIQIDQSPAVGQSLSRYLPSVGRARTELGLRQTINLAEAIRRTASWWRASSSNFPQ